jgi:FixJ family two-component response regulator
LKVPMIAIVDDEESVRVATCHLVRSLGFEVEAFASAQDFLQSGRGLRFSCIISDVNMPGVSGIELQRRLAVEGRSVPFVFITAFPDDAIKERAIGAGAVGFLSKPFNSGDLIDCIERALRRNESSH